MYHLSQITCISTVVDFVTTSQIIDFKILYSTGGSLLLIQMNPSLPLLSQALIIESQVRINFSSHT